VNEERTLTIAVLPVNVDEKTIAWMRNNTAVANISNAKVNGISSGSAIIVAYVDENGTLH